MGSGQKDRTLVGCCLVTISMFIIVESLFFVNPITRGKGIRKGQFVYDINPSYKVGFSLMIPKQFSNMCVS